MFLRDKTHIYTDMRWTLLLLGAALARNSAQENKEKRKKSRLLRKRVKKFERIIAKKRGKAL